MDVVQLGAARVFALAESLGGVESLVCHPIMTIWLDPKDIRSSRSADTLLRLVGIEDIEDIKGS
jgi:cystathionine beta-lyase/cystathionine gamma-synthase